MKPINFIPTNTSAYHIWSLHLWQEKYQKAVGYALEVLGGEYAFWAIKKGHLFAQALAVVQHVAPAALRASGCFGKGVD